jgi:hypothetical protein
MANSTLLRTAGGGTYIFGWVNEAGDRGFTAMGKQLDRVAKTGPRQLKRPLRDAAKTLKRSDLTDVPGGIYQTIRRHPYGAILAGTAMVYLVSRWRRG